MRFTHCVATSCSGSLAAGVRMPPWRQWVGVLLASALGVFAGCSNDKGALAPNQAPETEITSSVPANGEVVVHHVQVQFNGRDPDGKVPGYEYLVHTYPRSMSRYADSLVTLPAANDPRWAPTGSGETNSVLDLVLLADTLRADPQGDIGTGRFDRWHTVFVRAIDNEGAIDPSPDHRTFDAYTPAPNVWLLLPALSSPNILDLPRSFALRWNGVDPIDDAIEPQTQDPQATRWVLMSLTSAEALDPALIKQRLYNLPNSAWTSWTAWGQSDSTREARLYDVISSADAYYAFAVQGLDDGGAITPQFGDRYAHDNNFAILHVDASLPVGPRVPVIETQANLGAWEFDGDTAPIIPVAAASADTVTLEWGPMDTLHYGGKSQDYRYGWNITDTGDDGQWSPWSTAHEAPPHKLALGGDRFFLQARDHLGLVTLARIEFQK